MQCSECRSPFGRANQSPDYEEVEDGLKTLTMENHEFRRQCHFDKKKQTPSIVLNLAHFNFVSIHVVI